MLFVSRRFVIKRKLSMRVDRRGEEVSSTRAEVVYLCIAADLLRQMMSELQRTDDSRLVPAIAAARHDIHRRLHLLLATVDSLVAEANPTRATNIGRRAKLMIYRLAGEIEQLAIQAQVDGDPHIA